MDNAACLNMGGPLNAISGSPDGSHVIVAGRESKQGIILVFKLNSMQY